MWTPAATYQDGAVVNQHRQNGEFGSTDGFAADGDSGLEDSDSSGSGTRRQERQDQRDAVFYLNSAASDDYIAIMRVLDAAVVDMTPSDVVAGLRAAGVLMDQPLVEERLKRLYDFGVVDRFQDNTNVRVIADLLDKNFRYTPTGVGRQVQRFYERYLTGAARLREIAIVSLKTVVAELEALANPEDRWTDVGSVQQRVNNLFNAHESLDTTLIDAESGLMKLASRFDLDDGETGELKSLLFRYVTFAVNEIELGSEQASTALRILEGRFDRLMEITVSQSTASELINREILSASRGGSMSDWGGLVRWYDPDTGRGARFARRILGALPTFHANLRRLQTSGPGKTTRSRALLLAKACLDTDHAQRLYLAALGDHPWRKLHGEAEDPGAGRVPPWRLGPQVETEKWQFSTGATGSRGKAPAVVDDSAERAAHRARLEQAKALRERHEAEVLAASPGQDLSVGAARVAYEVLTAAARARSVGGRRTARRDGLACTIVPVDRTTRPGHSAVSTGGSGFPAAPWPSTDPVHGRRSMFRSRTTSHGRTTRRLYWSWKGGRHEPPGTERQGRCRYGHRDGDRRCTTQAGRQPLADLWKGRRSDRSGAPQHPGAAYRAVSARVEPAREPGPGPAAQVPTATDRRLGGTGPLTVGLHVGVPLRRGGRRAAPFDPHR